MIYRFVLSPDAEEHIRSATRWYANEDINLPLRFRSELKQTLARIAQNPHQFPVVRGVVKRALMNRFKYAVYFRICESTINVVAVLHQHRLSSWSRP